MGNSKAKIFIFGKDNICWSIDKDREVIAYFLKKNDLKITNNIFEATHIFCVWYNLLFHPKYLWMQLLRKILHFKIIVVITNDITFCPEKLKALSKYVDIFIAPSKKIYGFLKEKKLRVYKIPFFVDPKIFKPLYFSQEEICKRLNLNWERLENKIVIGSFQRDSLGKDLSQSKWQKNPDLLIEVLENLPKGKFTLLLAGPRRHYIINKCLEKNVDFLFYGNYSYIQNKKDDILSNNLPLEKVNYLYNLTNIYIVTSKSEGGPKSILESALTETLIFSTNVGLASDILHPDLIFDENNVGELIEKIYRLAENFQCFERYIEYNYQNALKEMNDNLLKEKYKTVILENP